MSKGYTVSNVVNEFIANGVGVEGTTLSIVKGSLGHKQLGKVDFLRKKGLTVLFV